MEENRRPRNRRQSRQAKRRAEMKRRMIPALFAIILIIIAGSIYLAATLIQKYSESDERADLAEYFKITAEDDVAILMQDTLLEDKGKLIDGEVYINTDTLYDYVNERFYWDAVENILVYTTPTEMITAEVGSHDYTVAKTKNTEDYAIVKTDGDVAYVALKYIQKYTNIDFEVMTEPNRVHITTDWGEVQTVTAKEDTFVRRQAGVKSPILTDVKKGDKLYVLPEETEIEKWTRVRSADGFIGYVRDKRLSGEVQTETTSREFEEPVYTNIQKDYTINMAWHQVDNAKANDTILSKIANSKGLTTISPTWFFIKDNDGNIESLASQTYVNYCHQSGIEVWGLVNNIQYADSISTHDILSKTSSRQRLVNQLIAEAIKYDLDGINVDLESIEERTAKAYIEFIRELSIMCRLNGLVLSVDNYVPTYTPHYNRKEQGIVADYVIIMGYDEHYSGSTEAGSVASIGFVRQGIEDTLKEVPAEKVINGVPFFTRLWKQTPKTEEELAADTSEEKLPYKVESAAYGMDAAAAKVSDNGATPEWDEETGQYYAEYESDGSLYRIWLEEEKSIEEKAKLIKEYDLAGISAWKLGFERMSIWDVILKYVN